MPHVPALDSLKFKRSCTTRDIFLNERPRSVPVSLIHKRFTSRDLAKNCKITRVLLVVLDPSPAMATHAEISLLILSTMVGIDDSCRLKTLSFRSIQIS
jgi:hypothetical protein